MEETRIPIRRALISVSDKTGLEALGRRLQSWGTQIFSTGGTATILENWGIPVTPVEAFTGFPEILEGRVKTLHPKIFAGLLARKDHPEDLAQLESHQMLFFDLVVVNLYPFEKYRGAEIATQVPWIDIGGPSLIRAAAKNHERVTVLSSPEDYPLFLQSTESQPSVTLSERRFWAMQSFRRTAEYDLMIFEEWHKSTLPQQVRLSPQTPLRYGENPHQKASWCGVPDWQLLQGKELSYNNLLDAEAASQLVAEFSEPCLAIIKHNNPCGVAWGNKRVSELFQQALEADSKSAFGGIVATNQPVDVLSAQALSEVFLEVILAPSFELPALEFLNRKKNLRLIQWQKPFFSNFEIRPALGGFLVQERDPGGTSVSLKAMTSHPLLTPRLKNDIEGAWKICKHVRSNAIVIVQDQRTVGIGGGQVSRIDALNLAVQKARPKLHGAVLASDAFFPFRDNIEALQGLPILAIVEPGGSQRDAEVIQACQEFGFPLYFTGERHFKH